MQRSPVFLHINMIGATQGIHKCLIQPFLKYSSNYRCTFASSAAETWYWCLNRGIAPGSSSILCTVALSAGIPGGSKKTANSAAKSFQWEASGIDPESSPTPAHVSAYMATMWLADCTNISQASQPRLISHSIYLMLHRLTCATAWASSA